MFECCFKVEVSWDDQLYIGCFVVDGSILIFLQIYGIEMLGVFEKMFEDQDVMYQ